MTTQSDEFELPEMTQNEQKPAKKPQPRKKAAQAPKRAKSAPQTPPQPEPDTNQPQPEQKPESIPQETPSATESEKPATGIGWTIGTEATDAEPVDNFEGWDFSAYGIQGEGVNVTYGPKTEVDVNPVSLMSPDQFYQNFEGLFGIAGAVTSLQSVPIAGHEKEGARATSDILYEQCCKISWLNFLVDEDSADASKYIAVAMFGFGKYAAVRGELAARRAAANDNKGEGEKNAA